MLENACSTNINQTWLTFSIFAGCSASDVESIMNGLLIGLPLSYRVDASGIKVQNHIRNMSFMRDSIIDDVFVIKNGGDG